ncbi:MAG: AAA family ATPase [Proteobacteria bacterium]|nr:AAA family ATPase [Pseudomonadota bacterium]
MSGRKAHVIVVGNEKGGSGKSTTAMHIAIGLLRAGNTVATIDVDSRQGTLSRYIVNRERFNRVMGRDYPMPSHFRVETHGHMGMTDADLAAAESKLRLTIEGALLNRDAVIIDTPGAANRLSFLAHTYADTLVTPINDSFVDLDVLAHLEGQGTQIKGPSHYAEAIWEAKKIHAGRDSGSMDWVVMRNRLTNLAAHNKREMELSMRELAKRLGFRTVSGFGERVVFRELFLVGLTILDLKEAAGGQPLSRSHVAARDEVMELIQSLRLPSLAPEARAAG